MGNLIGQIRAIYTRLRVLFTHARVLRVDESTALQTFDLEGFLSEVRANVPRVGEWGFASSPPEGSQAFVAALGADRGNLVVLGVEDRDTRPTLLAGEVQVYTSTGPVLRAILDGAGDHSVGVLGNVVNLGTGTQTAAVNISGAAVVVFAGSTGATMFADGGPVSVVSSGGSVTITGTTVVINGTNFDTHTHAVPAGTDSSGGVTGPPL